MRNAVFSIPNSIAETPDGIGVAVTPEVAARRASHVPAPQPRLAGALEKYAALVRPAHEGAVTHSGNLQWPYETPEAE